MKEGYYKVKLMMECGKFISGEVIMAGSVRKKQVPFLLD